MVELKKNSSLTDNIEVLEGEVTEADTDDTSGKKKPRKKRAKAEKETIEATVSETVAETNTGLSVRSEARSIEQILDLGSIALRKEMIPLAVAAKNAAKSLTDFVKVSEFEKSCKMLTEMQVEVNKLRKPTLLEFFGLKKKSGIVHNMSVLEAVTNSLNTYNDTAKKLEDDVVKVLAIEDNAKEAYLAIREMQKRLEEERTILEDAIRQAKNDNEESYVIAEMNQRLREYEVAVNDASTFGSKQGLNIINCQAQRHARETLYARMTSWAPQLESELHTEMGIMASQHGLTLAIKLNNAMAEGLRLASVGNAKSMRESLKQVNECGYMTLIDKDTMKEIADEYIGMIREMDSTVEKSLASGRAAAEMGIQCEQDIKNELRRMLGCLDMPPKVERIEKISTKDL
jgi:hypothetical protein